MTATQAPETPTLDGCCALIEHGFNSARMWVNILRLGAMQGDAQEMEIAARNIAGCMQGIAELSEVLATRIRERTGR